MIGPQICYILFLGPTLPFNIDDHSLDMVTSSTGRGVVVFGKIFEPMNIVMELTGDSIDTLEWKILNKSLMKYDCHKYAIPLTQNAFVNLMQKNKKNKTRKHKIDTNDDHNVENIKTKQG